MLTPTNPVQIGAQRCGKGLPLLFIAGPCVIESEELILDVSQRLADMAGNLGSFLTGLAFPYLVEWTGSHVTFFYIAAGLNILAATLWLLVWPQRPLAEDL